MNNDVLDRVRIASPCQVGWENMSGSDRARFCNQCNLHVYNISQLSLQEARDLITKTEGSICARIYRRADGTILTRDCPVGLLGVRRRVTRIGGAVVATVLGLFSVVVAQKRDEGSCRTVGQFQVQKKSVAGSNAKLRGHVLDAMGATLPGATLLVIDKQTKATYKRQVSESGEFVIENIPAGHYRVKVESPSFKSALLKELTVVNGEEVNLSITLNVSGETFTVGLLTSDENYESRPPGTTIFREGLIKKLPM